MKGSGNRRCRQRQHVNVGTKVFDLLFICHAKALLLINNQKSQIFILHIFGKHSVGPDHDIHQTFLQVLNGFLLLGRCPETAQQIDPYRELFHSLHKRVVMLLCKNGCRHQINNLPALLHSLECRTYRHFRLSVSHVTTDQTIHDLAALHIALCILNGFLLVFRLFIGKKFLELFLPDGIRPIHISFFCLTCRIELHQILCHFLNSALYLCAGLLPV